MKVLLLCHDAKGRYGGTMLATVEAALTHAGIGFDRLEDHADLPNRTGYDLYLGTGDEFLRRRPHLVREVRKMGGISADLRSRYLPLQPRYYPKLLGLRTGSDPDYVFTHFKSHHRRALYIGQGVNEAFLYPDHDDIFTVFVDHYFGHKSRRDRTAEVLDACRRLHGSRADVRIWHHTSRGIVENQFTRDTTQYKLIPFEDITRYYRKTHVFLPTHRESQGMLGAEIGMCGGLTLLQPYMYPKARREQVPHLTYDRDIPWPDSIDFAANRAKTSKTFGKAAFAQRLKRAIETAVGGRETRPQSQLTAVRSQS